MSKLPGPRPTSITREVKLNTSKSISSRKSFKIPRYSSQRISPFSDPMRRHLMSCDDVISLYFYDNLFLMLNSQKTIVESVKIEFPQASELTENDKKAVADMEEIKRNMLSATYANIFKRAGKFTHHLQNLIESDISEFLYPVILKLMKPISHISRITNILDSHVANPEDFDKGLISFKESRAYTLSPFGSPHSPSQSNYPKKRDEELIICRICEHPVFKSQFDEHIKTCYAAFKSTEPIAELDDKLRGAKTQLREKLKIVLPAKKTMMLQVMVPLHMIAMIDKVLSPYTNYDDFYKLCGTVTSTLTRMIPYSPTDAPLISQIILLTKRKVVQSYYASQILRDAQSSTVDSDSEVSLTPSNSFVGQQDLSIDNFIFLKQISKGAFARVFLCTKKATGDLFAIKVVPKKFIKQKENRTLKQHILHEKDFLFHLSSKYVVKICMYLFFQSTNLLYFSLFFNSSSK